MRGAEEVAFENFVVVQCVQALLGLISQHMNTISVQIVDGGIKLYFAMSECDEDDLEDIEDAVLEFEALTDSKLSVETDVHVGMAGPGWPGWPFRRLYSARPTKSGTQS